jgi:1-phosphatidylinositol phosphodiesterase
MSKLQTTRLASLLALIGLAVSIGLTETEANDDGTNFSEKPRTEAVKKYSHWMARLPDCVTLSELSLPGTHDSCALRDGFSFGFAKCQTWHLAGQLRAGIRFIDIRCRHVNDQLLIYHGIIDQHMTFAEVRDVCRTFLQEHPSECIVMSVKEESTAANTTRSFAEAFAEATKNDGDLWYMPREIPELGSVRQRIVLIDRVGTIGGVRWDDLERQDEYDAPLERKTQLIRSHFEQATKADKRRWFINFCSGTVPKALVTPKQYAAISNQAALEFLAELGDERSVRIGTVVMDFPDEDIIERIVELNFQSAQVN